MTTLNNELNSAQLGTVSGGWISLGHVRLPQLEKATKSPSTPTCQGPASTDSSTIATHKSASFDPVMIRF